MTELYRGLLLVVTTKFYELILAFRSHIRSFKEQTSDPYNYFDVGVLGFWNLILEIIFIMFSLICLIAGISLIAVLAIGVYPLYAILQYSSLLIKNTRNPPAESLVSNDKLPSSDSAVIIKNNGKEKE